MTNDVIESWKSHLPVAAVLAELRAALAARKAAVLVAPPGAGKTTTVPLALLDAAWMAGRKMLLLAPRRLAARAAAQRMAHLLGESVGQTVGYRIRLESKVGPETRIEVVTEGVLTRRLQSDPGLSGVGLVIFDEFHERNLDADLGLALCREVQDAFNEELRLLVMSATLDPAPVAALLDNAPLVRCEGRAFPVETRYVSPRTAQPVQRAVADVILKSLRAAEGNILAFLPGAPEIRRVAGLLEAADLPDTWRIAPLYGLLSRAAQDAAIAPPPAGFYKIVLATAIAETSLTIEGIRVVVDSGLQRAPRFDPRAAMTRLVTLPVSRASADQRMGRAGRLAPGICYRLWSEQAHAALPAYNRPEILDTDLAGLALELLLWGTAEPESLVWLDPPPAGAFEQARALLAELEAADHQGKITSHGSRMAQLPVHPRLAHMLLAAQAEGQGAAACDLAALLSERDPLRFSGGRDADLRLRLEVLGAFRAHRPLSVAAGEADAGLLRQIVQVAAQLRQRLGIQANEASTPHVGRLLAWAYPDRIALARSGSVGRYRLVNGRGAYFDPPEPLGAHDCLAIAELDGDRREARIFLAAAYDREMLTAQFDRRIQQREVILWDESRQALMAERRWLLGELVLRSEALSRPDPQAVMAGMLAAVRKMGLEALPWTPALRTWQSRVLLLRRIEAGGEVWPDLSDAALGADLEAWLAPCLEGVTSRKALARIDLSGALRNRLTWRQQQLVERLAPTHITVPSGSRRPIDYGSDPPVLAVRLQELFGCGQTPTIAEGRITLQLHLLSPAGRPAQITRDLAGFWRNSYPEVKKELKGRYPKHYWPDDPINAAPTARTKPRHG